MAERHTYVERTGDSGTGMASGMVLGIVLLLLVAIVALFFVFGGPSRFAGGTTTAPNQTNVNVPAQQQQPQSGPNINVPRQIDVNVNQPPAQQSAPQQPAQQSAPQQPAAPNR